MNPFDLINSLLGRGGSSTGITNPLLPTNIGSSTDPEAGTKGLAKFVSALVNLFVVLAVLMALVFLILGGLQWITGGGDKSQMEQARNKITHSIIGLIIVAASWSIWLLVGKFLGINFNNMILPSLK